MRIILEVVSGPAAGRRLQLGTGQVAHVGRATWADLCLSQDRLLSGMHFVLECSPGSCTLRDLDSDNGTLVNGVRTSRAVLREGDEIFAGQTTFAVRGATESTAVAMPPTW